MPDGFVSSGAAVAATLQEILARKKVEALQQQAMSRQAQLDELNKRNVESEMAAREENARSSAEQRKHQAELFQAQADERRANQLDAMGIKRGEPIPEGVDPDILASYTRMGRINPTTPAPIPSTKTLDLNVPPTPGADIFKTIQIPDIQKPSYRGSPEDIASTKYNERVEGLIPALSQMYGPDAKRIIEGMLKVSEVTGDKVSMENILTALKPAPPTTKPRYTMGPRGEVISRRDFEADATFDQLPAPPQGPEPVYMTGTKDGKPWAGWVQKGTLPEGVTDIRLGNQPAAGTTKPLIPDVTSRALAALRDQRAVPPTGVSQERADARFQAGWSNALTQVSQFVEDKQIIAAIRRIMNNDDTTKTTYEVLEEERQRQLDATPEEWAIFEYLLLQIRGEGRGIE